MLVISTYAILYSCTYRTVCTRAVQSEYIGSWKLELHNVCMCVTYVDAFLTSAAHRTSSAKPDAVNSPAAYLVRSLHCSAVSIRYVAHSCSVPATQLERVSQVNHLLGSAVSRGR